MPVVGHIDGLAGADSAKLDAGAQILYVVTGGKDVPLDYSFLVAIDLRTNKKIGELRFESNHVEALALESASSRLFINITDKHEVAVVDRKSMQVITRWPIDGSGREFSHGLRRSPPAVVHCLPQSRGCWWSWIRIPAKSWQTFRRQAAQTISLLMPAKGPHLRSGWRGIHFSLPAAISGPVSVGWRK